MACGLALKRPLELDSLHSPEGVKRARLSPFRTSYATAAAASPSSSPSVFQAIPSNRLSHQQLDSFLRAEMKALRRRRLLPPTPPRPTRYRAAPRSPNASGSDDDDQHSFPDDPSNSKQTPASFSISQVQQICERLLKEQEDRLRAQYDTILNAKLNEQYETFVKFTQDQIHRQHSHHEPPSYLS